MHDAYVREYQAASDVPHSQKGKGANGIEWFGYWIAQKFATTDAAGNKVVSEKTMADFLQIQRQLIALLERMSNLNKQMPPETRHVHPGVLPLEDGRYNLSCVTQYMCDASF